MRAKRDAACRALRTSVQRDFGLILPLEGGAIPDLPEEQLPNRIKPGIYFPPNFDLERGAGLYMWDAAVWMAQRPSCYDVARRLGHLDEVMSASPEEIPAFRWERLKRLDDFHFGPHTAWMGF